MRPYPLRLSRLVCRFVASRVWNQPPRHERVNSGPTRHSGGERSRQPLGVKAGLFSAPCTRDLSFRECERTSSFYIQNPQVHRRVDNGVVSDQKKKSGTARGCGGWLVRETPRVLCVSSPSVPGPRQASASRIWPYCDVQHGTAAAVAAVFLLLHTSGSARRSACCGNPRPAASAVCLRLLAGASAPLPGLSHPLPGEPVTSGRSSYTCGLPGESRSGAGARTTTGKSWSG